MLLDLLLFLCPRVLVPRTKSSISQPIPNDALWGDFLFCFISRTAQLLNIGDLSVGHINPNHLICLPLRPNRSGNLMLASTRHLALDEISVLEPDKILFGADEQQSSLEPQYCIGTKILCP